MVWRPLTPPTDYKPVEKAMIQSGARGDQCLGGKRVEGRPFICGHCPARFKHLVTQVAHSGHHQGVQLAELEEDRGGGFLGLSRQLAYLIDPGLDLRRQGVAAYGDDEGLSDVPYLLQDSRKGVDRAQTHDGNAGETYLLDYLRRSGSCAADEHGGQHCEDAFGVGAELIADLREPKRCSWVGRADVHRDDFGPRPNAKTTSVKSRFRTTIRLTLPRTISFPYASVTDEGRLGPSGLGLGPAVAVGS